MAFIDNVPIHHKALKMKLGKTNVELSRLTQQIDEQQYDDDYFDHDCDCEYCEIMEARKSTKQMTDKELVEAKKDQSNLINQIAELRKTIRGLEGYAKSFNRPIPKEDLLK